MQIYVKSKDCSTESCTFVPREGKQAGFTGNLQAEFADPHIGTPKRLLGAGADADPGAASLALLFPAPGILMAWSWSYPRPGGAPH